MSTSNELPTVLNHSLERLIEKESFNNYEINHQRIIIDGGNYLGTLYEIDIEGRTKDGDKKNLHLVAKHIIDGTELKQVSVPSMYESELFAYKELFKIFAEMQEEACVPVDERYQTAQFYDESNPEVIIMGNLTKRGFTSHRTEGTSLKFFEAVVKQIAKFHGLSMVIREKEPEYFNKKIKSIKYPYFFNDTWKKVVLGIRDNSLNYVDEKNKDIFSKLYEQSVYKYAEYCDDESTNVCLCHGDYKPNNVMIKTDKDETKEMIIIDYQMIHYGCPIFDFFYLIFTSTDRKFRQAHLSDLKELYYETLRTTLRYFDLDAEVVYSKEEFDKVYKDKFDFGLMCGLIFMPLVVAAHKDLPDFTQSELHFTCDDIIKDRLIGVLDDYVEWGFV